MNSLEYFYGMAVLRGIFNFYINSSIHVALAVCALTFITCSFLNLVPNLELFGFIFFATVTGYNFVKYAGTAKLHHAHFADSLWLIQVFSLLCLIIALVFALSLPLHTLLTCIPLGLLTLFYSVPIAPKGNNLRSFPTLKIFVIAAVWAGTTVYLPVVDTGVRLDFEIWLLILQRSLLVLALILPFEIRDVVYDDRKIGTFPQMLGVRNTKIIGYCLLAVYLSLGFFSPYISQREHGVTLALALMTAVAIYFAKAGKDHYYCAFWVEGIPILGWILCLFI